MMRKNLVFGAMLLASRVALAQVPGQNPDWPCQQRLTETLAVGTYWQGQATADPEWRNDQTVFPLVTDIVDRDTTDADAQAKLAAYADTIPAADRAKRYPALFAAIVDQANDVRTPLIQRLEQLGRRQRGMGDSIAAISTRIDKTAPTDPKYNDLVGERDFDVRAFQQTQHTMRYACDAPPAMERRLGDFARLLQSKQKGK